MKKDIKQLLQTLQELKPVLTSRFAVKSIEVFGSYAKGEENRQSDLDLLVSFENTPGLFKYMELENFLSDSLGIKVDLVMRDSIKPQLASSIFQTIITV
ncbi:MAG: nucleotidyltransferase family protein [Bacteroidetes bacterium]|nr:nucleotidyltransferase family protein [Bacteroidota bacterium]